MTIELLPQTDRESQWARILG